MSTCASLEDRRRPIDAVLAASGSNCPHRRVCRSHSGPWPAELRPRALTRGLERSFDDLNAAARHPFARALAAADFYGVALPRDDAAMLVE